MQGFDQLRGLGLRQPVEDLLGLAPRLHHAGVAQDAELLRQAWLMNAKPLFKRADGATESIDEVLALPEDELMSKVQFTGVTFGGPGTTNYVALDLEPGTYFLLCFLPQGGGEDGPPHFMAGMKHTLTVA